MSAHLVHLHQILDNGANTPRGPEDGDPFHDAAAALANVGDASSVPHLIRALHFFADQEIAGTKFGIICTQAHLVEALQRITGAKVGVSYSSWKRWWDTTHPGESLDPPTR
jgi:hypothetical protein